MQGPCWLMGGEIFEQCSNTAVDIRFLPFLLRTGIYVDMLLPPVMAASKRPLVLPENLSSYTMDLGLGFENLFKRLESNLVIINKSHKKRSYPLTQISRNKKQIFRKLSQWNWFKRKAKSIHIKFFIAIFSRTTKNSEMGLDVQLCGNG